MIDATTIGFSSQIIKQEVFLLCWNVLLTLLTQGISILSDFSQISTKITNRPLYEISFWHWTQLVVHEFYLEFSHLSHPDVDCQKKWSTLFPFSKKMRISWPFLHLTTSFLTDNKPSILIDYCVKIISSSMLFILCVKIFKILRKKEK